MTFKRAVKESSKLRMVIGGVSGSGKTMSALKIATGMGGRIAFIDTEHGSASKYANEFNFDVIEMDKDFSPDQYIKQIQEAVHAGYDILIIDSLTHAWHGKNGVLEQVENHSTRNGGNSFKSWGAVGTPLQNKFVEAILAAPIHIIACSRMKQEYAMDKDDKGKTTIKKMGMGMQQREGIEYEFDILGEIDLDHKMAITKTRCIELVDKVFHKPGNEVSDILVAWLGESQPIQEQSKPKPLPEPIEESEPTPPPEPETPKAHLIPLATRAANCIGVFAKSGIELHELEEFVATKVDEWTHVTLDFLGANMKQIKKKYMKEVSE